MNPTQLLTFALVGQLKSISRAAEKLHIGQPAVSGQLKLLQQSVGEPLYKRKGHQIAMTAIGEELLVHAENLLRNFQQAEEFVCRLQAINSGLLRIGSTTTIASYYLPRYVVQMQTQHPGLQIFMKSGDSMEIVKALPELDIGFIEGALEDNGLPGNYEVLPWCEDEIVLVVRYDHELAKRYETAVPLDVFSRFQVIWREPGSGARQIIEQNLHDAGIVAPVNIQVTGVAGVKASVRAGLGIGFASFQALRYSDNELVSRRIDPPTSNGLIWQLNILAPKLKLRSRAVQAFIELCKDQEFNGVDR